MNRKIVAAIAALALGAVAFTGCEVASKAELAGLEQVHIGDSTSQVRSLMGGEPSDVQTFDHENYDGTTTHEECWYYGMDVQICFEDGQVRSKNNY